MAWRLWQDLKTTDLDALDAKRSLVVLPLAATEQHGPHLPVGTDVMIAEGLMAVAAQRVPAELDILVLPLLSVGASMEHARSAGTLSIASADLADQIVTLAGCVKACGLDRLVIVSSHGGNVAAMLDASLRCRKDLDMLAVHLTWGRLGLPDDIVCDDERAFGVHGGFVETSLMLHFRPELVAMDRAENFDSLQQRMGDDYELLRAYGPIGFGWLAEDLSRHGVVGDASSANADAGKAIAEHQAARFAVLLQEVCRADTQTLLAR